MPRSPWSFLPSLSVSVASTPFTFNGSGPRLRWIGAFAAAALLFCTTGQTASAQSTFTGGGAITATGVNGSGSSILSVSGASGSVKTVYVTLNGVTSNGTSCCDSVFFTSFVLESPGGTKMVLLGGTGDSIDGNDAQNSGSGLLSSTITIEDGKSAAPQGAAWAPQGSSFTVEPSSYWLLPNLNGPQYASIPSDINGDKLPQTDGTSSDGPDTGDATLNGTFANSAANGNWTLYILTDDTFGSNDVVSVSSWSLTMTFNATVSDPTTTSVSSNTASPASTANSITYTATVTDNANSGTSVGTGTVAFTANGATISGCGSLAVSGGEATCNTTLSTQGLYAIQADYSAGTGFESSSSSNLEQLVEHPSSETQVSTNTWCNSGSLTVPGQSTALAYPSVIKVSGYPTGTTVGNVEVELENVSGVLDAQSLLVAPNGTSNLDFFDNGFNQGVNISTGVTLNFYDSAGAYPDPDNGPTGGDTYNYEASDTLSAGNTDTFASSPAPTYDTSIPQVPSTVHYGYDPFQPSSRGAVTETFESNFNGAPANGTWALYPYEADAVQETIGGGWCIALTINPGTPTTTTLTSNANPLTPQQPVNLTATVKAGSNLVTSGGTVTFLENGTAPQGTSGGDNVVNVNTQTGQTTTGEALFSTGTLSSTITIDPVSGSSTTKTIYEGDFPLSAEYSGDTSDNPSNGNLVQRFDNTTLFSAGSGGSINACNAGPVLLSTGVEGAFAPNPSNIFVANMPGTLNTVTLTLNGWFTANEDTTDFTQALLKGPTGAALDFFSNTGNASTVLGGTTSPWGSISFADSASNNVPTSQSGYNANSTYKPTAYQGSVSTDSFTSSSSGFYNVPGSFNYASPRNTNTSTNSFAANFGNTSPNGTWSLFFNTTDFLDAEGAQSGWCLNFTENPVTVSVDLSHSGDGASGDFVQGEGNAQITTVVQNSGSAGSTGDPVGGNPLTVTDTMPAGLTYTGTFSGGPSWSCSGTTTVTCTNDSSIPAGSSYPTLTLNVNVSSTAPTSISNSVSVSGAGVTSNSGSDSIPVVANPGLSISKSHSGSFAVGSQGVWTLIVSNDAANGSTSGTVTVVDSLPTGFSLASYTSSSNLWTCNGTTSVTCTATPGIAGGASSTINLTVSVPSNPSSSDSNTAEVYGGGDPVHNSLGTAAVSNTDTVNYSTTTTTATSETATYSTSSQQVAFSATVISTSGQVSGSVTFTVLNGSTQVGTQAIGTLANGFASANFTLPAGTGAGTYTIQAQYSGTGTTFLSSSDSSHILVVQKAQSTTSTSSASANYSASSQPVTLSASVTSSAGQVNEGTVTFSVFNGGTQIGSAVTSGTVSNGSASATYTLPGGTAGGTYAIDASYNSGPDFNTSSDNTHTLTVVAAPLLSVSKSHLGTFAQGGTGQWNIAVSNAAGVSPTSGTVTVTDSLPTGYTLNSYTAVGVAWNCGGSANLVTCTTAASIAAGNTTTISLTVNIPASSPTSVSNTAAAYGGSDVIHSGPSSAAVSNTDSVSVAQVPASINIISGNNQSATVGTAFPNPLTVEVVDGAGNPISSVAITFTVFTTGPAGTFSNSSTTITGNTNGSGEISESITANTVAGAYAVGARNSSGSQSTIFNLANSAGPATSLTISSGNNQSAPNGQNFNVPLAVLVADTYGNPVPGATVTFTAPASGASLTFAGGVNTAITNGSGVASVTVTANTIVGSYQVNAAVNTIAGVLQVTFSLTNSIGPLAQFGFTTPSSAYAGIPITFTVTAQDSNGNTETNYTGTVSFTSTDTAAMLPGASTLTNGTGTFTATLDTLGGQTITASDAVNSISSNSSSINVVAAPNFVVNTTADDAGSASNCSQQTSPGINSTDSACSLRDALLVSTATGAGNISFSTTVFSSPQTITLSNGSMHISSYTGITGPATAGKKGAADSSRPVSLDGSKPIGLVVGAGGSSPTNLVTVNGGGSGVPNNGTIFVANGTSMAITNLNISGGYASNGGNGGAITNFGTMSISGITFTGNQATSSGGGIFNANGTLMVSDSTFVGNNALGGNGGAIDNAFYSGCGTVTITNSTFYQNTAALSGGGSGGAINNDTGCTLTVADSTIAGNSDDNPNASGGGIANRSTLNLGNSIVSANSNGASAEDDVYNVATLNNQGGNVTGDTASQIQLAPLGNYGGVTQTMIPLPGSPAICGGLTSAQPSGVTTDQRGESNQNTTYPGYSGETPCVDSGAVQTNYAIGFAVQPPANVLVGQVLSPAPTVSLTESGAAIGISPTVMMTDSASLLTGTLSEPFTLGAATFSNLSISQAATGDVLTATLPLNSSLNLTTQASTPVNASTQAAQLISPTPGLSTILGTSNVQFTWTAGAGVTSYSLSLGTAGPGSSDLLLIGKTSKTTATAATIPAAGVIVFVQLGSLINGSWQYAQYEYTESGSTTPATLTPSSGTLSASQTFTWSNGVGPAQYKFWLGTGGPGTDDLYALGRPTTSTSVTVSIPSNGVTVYATLWQLINNVWQSTPYTFTEPGTIVPATLTPSSGTLSASQTFTWSNGVGPTEYKLWLGTEGPGTDDLYAPGKPTTNTSVTVTIPSNGVTVYATLFQLINNVWQTTPYTFTEPGTIVPATLTPSSGTLSASQTFTWSNGAGPVQYKLWLGTLGPGTSNLYIAGPTTNTSVTVPIPSNGVTVFATLWQLIDNVWQSTPYTFTEPGTLVPATLTPSSGTLSASQTFTWSNGAGPAEYKLRLGTSPGADDLYGSGPTFNTSVTLPIPSNGVTVYATLYQLINGTWQTTPYTFTEP